MKLIYAYLKSFKNYTNQDLLFAPEYNVTFDNGILSISCDKSSFKISPVNIHIVIGKTGAGKTNLLQLLGAKKEVRDIRAWNGEKDAYFLLYEVKPTSEFFIEICNMTLSQFPEVRIVEDSTIPSKIRKNANRLDFLRKYRFILEADGDFKIEGDRNATMWCSQRTLVFNCYDTCAFIKPPYEDDKETFDDVAHSDGWLPRVPMPYHRTSLWQKCKYIREYIATVKPGEISRKINFCLSTDNFAEKYPLNLSESLKNEYWTFSSLKRDEEVANIDDEAKQRVRWHQKAIDKLGNKDKFIHDLWADYAAYLRKWVEKILSYTEHIPSENLDVSGTRDVYQEFIDYYTKKNITMI